MNSAQIFIVALGLLALGAVACNGDTIVQGPGVTNGINASGTGRATGTPDVAILQLGVELEQPTVEGARSAAAQALEGVLASLRGNGVAEADIQTVQFNVSPQHDFLPPAGPNEPGRQVLRGYRVTNVIRAKVRTITNAGKVIDDATRAGGNAVVVRSLSFTIDDPTALREQARQDAVADARKRAEELARHGGVGLGKLLSIVEGGSQALPQPNVVRAPSTGSDTLTPIQPGELEVVVTVNALWSIE
jgi:uncharacterized protein YggE